MLSDNNVNPSLNDYNIPDPVQDTVQQLRFIPNKQSNILAGVGWDSKVRIWNVQYSLSGNNLNPAQIQSNLVYNQDLQDALLSVCWQPDSTKLFTGSADGKITAIDLNSSQVSNVGQHSLGVKELAWLPMHNCLLSGGWDGVLNIWDIRTPQPVMTYNLQKKIYTMSLTHPLLVVGCESRIITYFNLNKLNSGTFVPECMFDSHLKFQTRSIATFPEGNGYAIGSIEGRVAIKFVDLNKIPTITEDTKSMNTPEDFAFRCHRAGDNMVDVYPVNTIRFNPAYGTFTTGGGDGTWIIWCKDSRSRLKQGYHVNKPPITAVDYSSNGDLLAYASGYDYSKGFAFDNQIVPKISIHYCIDTDKKKKQKK